MQITRKHYYLLYPVLIRTRGKGGGEREKKESLAWIKVPMALHQHKRKNEKNRKRKKSSLEGAHGSSSAQEEAKEGGRGKKKV